MMPRLTPSRPFPSFRVFYPRDIIDCVWIAAIITEALALFFLLPFAPDAPLFSLSISHFILLFTITIL
jgi:hypothetical protein